MKTILVIVQWRNRGGAWDWGERKAAYETNEMSMWGTKAWTKAEEVGWRKRSQPESFSSRVLTDLGGWRKIERELRMISRFLAWANRWRVISLMERENRESDVNLAYWGDDELVPGTLNTRSLWGVQDGLRFWVLNSGKKSATEKLFWDYHPLGWHKGCSWKVPGISCGICLW